MTSGSHWLSAGCSRSFTWDDSMVKECGFTILRHDHLPPTSGYRFVLGHDLRELRAAIP